MKKNQDEHFDARARPKEVCIEIDERADQEASRGM